jgi:hypothetical protein
VKAEAGQQAAVVCVSAGGLLARAVQVDDQRPLRDDLGVEEGLLIAEQAGGARVGLAGLEGEGVKLRAGAIDLGPGAGGRGRVRGGRGKIRRCRRIG